MCTPNVDLTEVQKTKKTMKNKVSAATSLPNIEKKIAGGGSLNAGSLYERHSLSRCFWLWLPLRTFGVVSYVVVGVLVTVGVAMDCLHQSCTSCVCAHRCRVARQLYRI